VAANPPPESGLAPGWRSLFYSEMPALARYIPVSIRHQTVATKLGPAGTAWLFDRLNNKAELLPGEASCRRRPSAIAPVSS
jgi:hypothetical protein